ncbi:hypothetical protein DMUE_4642 [Dictyocoela muelleri]|nr:hypothetical protein DMUE_4642 [Dictyocoela muelleri]
MKTHDTKECRAIKANNNNKYTGPNNKNTNAYTFVVPQAFPKTLFLRGSALDKPIVAMIDTGATYNFINELSIPDNTEEIENVDEIKIELVDGRQITTNKMIKLE